MFFDLAIPKIMSKSNYKPSGRKKLSKELKKFEDDIAILVKNQMQWGKWKTIQKVKQDGRMRKNVVIHIWGIFREDRKGLDCPNIPKSICDALNKIVYEDDSQIYNTHVYYRQDKEEKLVILVEEIG